MNAGARGGSDADARGPVVLERLNGEVGDDGLQAIVHVGEHHLLVGVATDSNVDGTSETAEAYLSLERGALKGEGRRRR